MHVPDLLLSELPTAPEEEDQDWEDLEDYGTMDIDTFLAGDESISLSHAGGELLDVLEQDLQKDQHRSRYVLLSFHSTCYMLS